MNEWRKPWWSPAYWYRRWRYRAIIGQKIVTNEQERTVVDFRKNTATLDRPWDPPPSTGAKYLIGS